MDSMRSQKPRSVPGVMSLPLGKPVAADTPADRGDGAAERSPHIVLVQIWQQEPKRLVPPR
jgi:hypothetical protein